MISHSPGAMPCRTRDRLTQFADEWTNRSIRAWSEGWWDMPITVGKLIREIIDAPKGSIVMHQNVSICQHVILSALDWSTKRNKLVTESLNFPSNQYIFHHWPSYGARVKWLCGGPGVLPISMSALICSPPCIPPPPTGRPTKDPSPSLLGPSDSLTTPHAC